MERKYIVYSILYTLLFLSSLQLVHSALPAVSTSDYNLVVRNNENTFLKNFQIDTEIILKEERSEMMNYLTYEKDFSGKFILQNNGNEDDEIIIAYPFKHKCLTDRFSDQIRLPQNFKIFVDNTELSDYEVVCSPEGFIGLLGVWANGSFFRIDNVGEFSCSETEGPFTQKDKTSFCTYMDDSYYCYCDDRKVNDKYPRYLCEDKCYLRECTSESCKLCKDIDCILPYGKDLVSSTLVMFKLTIPKNTEKTINIQYHEDYGEDNVYFDFFDEYSWKDKKITGTVTYNIKNGKLRDYTDYEKKWPLIYREEPDYAKTNDFNSYTWKLQEIDSKMYDTSRIYIPLIENTIITNIKTNPISLSISLIIFSVILLFLFIKIQLLRNIVKFGWLKIISSIIIFIISFFGMSMFRCIGGTKYLCGNFLIDSLVYVLNWPIILFDVSISSHLGKSIFGLIVMVWFLMVQVFYIYLIISIITYLVSKIKSKESV